MSYQAYLDAIEKKTGLTPRQLLEQATERGFGPDTKAGEIVAWLKDEHALGHGHAMAFANVVRKGAHIGDKHVGTTGSHRDASDTLWLDGAATNPASTA